MKRKRPACSSQLQLHDIAEALGIAKLPLDRCEPSEALARIYAELGVRNVRDALARVRKLKKSA